MMLGYAGNYVILAPDKDLMLVMTGGGISEAVRPAMQGYPLNFAVGALTTADEALSENPEALAQLEAQIARIANPEPLAVEPMPEIVAQIDGRLFGLATLITLPAEGAAGATWRAPIAVGGVSFDFTDDAHVNVTMNTVSGDVINVTAAFNGLDVVSETPIGLLASHAQWQSDNELIVWIDYLTQGHLVRLDARFLPGMVYVDVVELTESAADFSAGIMQPQ